MPCGTATNDAVLQQLRHDQFHGSPRLVVAEHCLDLAQQPFLVSWCGPFRFPFQHQPTHIPQILICAFQLVSAGMTCLGRESGEGNEDLPFKSVFTGLEPTFTEFALPEAVAVRQHADTMNRPPEAQRNDRVPRFVICRDAIVRGWGIRHRVASFPAGHAKLLDFSPQPRDLGFCFIGPVRLGLGSYCYFCWCWQLLSVSGVPQAKFVANAFQVKAQHLTR